MTLTVYDTTRPTAMDFQPAQVGDICVATEKGSQRTCVGEVMYADRDGVATTLNISTDPKREQRVRVADWVKLVEPRRNMARRVSEAFGWCDSFAQAVSKLSPLRRKL